MYYICNRTVFYSLSRSLLWKEFLRYQVHLKLVDWPLLIPGAKPVYETEPMYNYFVNIQLYKKLTIYSLMSIKEGRAFTLTIPIAKILSIISRKIQIMKAKIKDNSEPMYEVPNYELRVYISDHRKWIVSLKILKILIKIVIISKSLWNIIG